MVLKNGGLRTRLGDVAAFENRQPLTAAKFITKSSCLFYCSALFAGWN